MNDSPYINLMLQFELQKPSANFIDYIDRKEAKEQLYGNYLSYMDRQKSQKISAQKISDAELHDLEENGSSTIQKNLEWMKKESFNEEDSVVKNTGLFDFFSDDLTKSEKKSYKQKYEAFQKNGNILFKDVLSFSTEALIEAGIYNPYTNQLNRKPLIEASRKMINKMIEVENLDTNLNFLGAIHYNTNHFHIHFASIETKNTRSSMTYNDEKTFRGVRNKNTVMQMKSEFANAIFDRTESLEKISALRNDLRYEIKDELLNATVDFDKNIRQQLTDLRMNLPDDTNKWTAKHLNSENQQRTYKLIDELMENNQDFMEYKNLSKEEDSFKSKLYGQNHLEGTFYQNRLYSKDGIYYRLSNSLLEDLRKEEKYFKKLDGSAQESKNNKGSQVSTSSNFKQASTNFKKSDQITFDNFNRVKRNYHQKNCLNEMKANFRKLTKNMNHYVSKEKYRAQQEYERMQQEIEYQNSRNGGLEL